MHGTSQNTSTVYRVDEVVTFCTCVLPKPKPHTHGTHRTHTRLP